MEPPSTSTADHPHSEELAQLSTQLISAGFLRQPLPSNTFFNGASSPEGQKLLLKAIWSMFASRSKEMSIREGLLAKQRELAYEHTRLEGFLERAEKEKLEAQQEATASTNRANAAHKELELEKARHRKTRDDYCKLKNAERLIKTTSVHELRKKTNELDELQRRLTKLSASKDLPPPSALNWSSSSSGPLVNRVDAAGGGRVGLLEFDLKASRDQNNHLQIDNSRLREYLGIYEQQLIHLISEISHQHDKLIPDSDDDDQPDQEENRFINTTSSCNVPLPKIYKRLSLVTYKLRERVLEMGALVEDLQNRMTDMSSRADQERVTAQKELDKMRREFEKEVETLKASLKKAEATIERWAHTGLAVEALSIERKKLAQEAIELSRQRAEMEMRKAQAERERILRELDLAPASNQQPWSSLSGRADRQGTGEHPSVDAAAKGTRATDAGNETLSSLVVYTKSKGKPRSSISKSLGSVHRVKQPVHVVSRLARNAPSRKGQGAVLKSLLSITGETEEGQTTASSSSAPLPPTAPTPSLSSLPPASSQPGNRTQGGASRTKFALARSNTRVSRPPR
ncbi:hypothetical protein VP01_324g3 [Puccinia sorghi]|uniref:Afadin and alpha-actinin-binding-domain-containing protein n=1 Tax=Puccinia sorghi TaxID=27349 RepID=A0A0L6UZX7_9BASI|nr:hypothetical protein VP01_324g3 [Puccinia sorghi]